MKDFVVYTAVTKGYDSLKSPPEFWRKDAHFVAFVETPQSVSGWEYRPIYRRFRDPTRNAKIHKILAHKYFPKARYTLWIDGSIQIKSTLPLDLWPNEYLQNNDLAVYKHPARQCAYMEAYWCILCGLDNPLVIDRQMKRYHQMNYPMDNGLAECTVLFRRNTKAIRRFNEAWYAEVKAHSRRDQLSFNYVATKSDLNFTYFPGSVHFNQHFVWRHHTGRRTATPV